MINPSDVRSPGQVAPEDEDTIELELTVEQMQALSRAAAVQQSKLSPFPLANDSSQQWKLAPTPLAKDSSLMPTGKSRSRAILLLGIAVASGLLSGYAYLAITRETPVQVAQAPAQVAEQMTPDSPAPEAPGLPRPVERKPVRFANPFDAKEVGAIRKPIRRQGSLRISTGDEQGSGARCGRRAAVATGARSTTAIG
jgi:hypothetical protein